MGQIIDVDFALLEKDMEKLKKIRKQLKEPKMSGKLDLVKSGKDGKGSVKSNIHSFSSTTIDYYKAVSLLLDNSISFLEKAQSMLQSADQGLAKKIKEGK